MHTWKYLEYLSPLVAELVYYREKSQFIHTPAAGGQHPRTQSERVGPNLGIVAHSCSDSGGGATCDIMGTCKARRAIANIQLR